VRCGLAHCPGAKSTHFSIIPVFSSHTFMQFCQDFSVILLIYHLAAGYPLCYHNTMDIKENNQHGLELRTTHACFFWSWRWCWLTLHRLSLGFQIIRKYQSFIIEKFLSQIPHFNKKLDVNSLTFAVRHFPTEDKNTPMFEDASTCTE
jgi:hypothetical protein